ncbi:hypothetical protein V496_01053 [Pseudogymnoascus sp. VKM F-4515 (FW-2607)]|nr:hypothetical protein V496_01053 [Pseudogymnoascus sp. VKM F-4515 (FW-2607)]KFY95942.1 hypothetical protein V498_03020 [Pseudogymnoascus sp. VKM F-4517 (FW-2822)]
MKIPFAFLAIMTALSSAHMELSYPAPLRSRYNKNVTANDTFNNVDYYMTSPLNASGSDYPCKGSLSDLGTPEGTPVEYFVAGDYERYMIRGTATHGGGSCQVSLSVDGGTTFKVIKSYIGSCIQPDIYREIKIPNDVPAGPAVFAWTWFNKLGNREMYMNCASITIEKGTNKTAPSVPFGSLPDIFVANISNNCSTAESSNVEFPDPGNMLDRGYKDESKDPIGSCAPISRRSSSRSSSSGSLNGATSRQSTTTTTSIDTSQTDVISKTSRNGTCNSLHTCKGSQFGHCCSKYGYCGSTADYCGDGCNPSFGTCNGPIGSSSSTAATDTTIRYITRTRTVTTKKTTTIGYTMTAEKPASTCT